jgi:hypothetical protein
MKELIEIQSKLKAPKNQRNNFGKYNYRSAEDILEDVKPLLKEQSCTLIIGDDIVQIGERYYIKATATLCNEKGTMAQTHAFAREAETKAGMDVSQITGATSSYARKYALNGLFAIDDNKDTDTPEYQQEPPYLAAVKAAQTVDQLHAVWNQFPQLQKEQTFVDVFTVRKKEIENAKH